METLLTLLGGALAAGAAFGLAKIKAEIFAKHYGPVIEKVFNVIDPIAAQLIERYDGSMVQDALELAVYRVADGDLNEKDVLAISKFVTEKFDITKAASAKLDPTTEEGRATLQVADQVKALFDGASKDELIELARTAISLV